MRGSIAVFMIVAAACVSGYGKDKPKATNDRPNILWITSEDNNVTWIGCYGNSNAKTPNIDALAKEGFRYAHCYSNAGVCAPSRSTWITGMHAVSNGTQPMRSRNKIPHDKIRYYPDLLREAGYYTSNSGKTDYNLGGRADGDCWDQKPINISSIDPGWDKLKEGLPFFAVVNILNSHGSKAHNNRKTPVLSDPDAMKLWKYHPDLSVIRENYARYADAVEEMDTVVGATIETLKKEGLYEDTIIIYCSDHGGVMSRSKRFIYASGIHCPLIVRIPEKWKRWYPAEKPGMVVDRLVSYVDMPKTWVSLAGGKIPETLQGTVFLGDDVEPESRHHFAFRGRADVRLDSVRVMRDKRFAYHKNYMPYAPAGQYLENNWRQNTTLVWEAYHREGKTDEITGRFFRPRVSEEFYDNQTDYDNVHNLIAKPERQKKIAELKAALRKKQLELYDSGLLPEEMRVSRAAANGITIYEMVRNKELYPLERYLDSADLALARDAAQLSTFVKWLSDKDAGMRWWGAIGLLLLEKEAAPAAEALTTALSDEQHEVRMMSAWTLVKIGKGGGALKCLEELLFGETTNRRMLDNVLDWMGEPALPLVKKYFEEGKIQTPTGRQGPSILGRIAQVNGWTRKTES